MMVSRAAEEAVREQLGLDPASLGASVLPRAIEHRIRKLGVASAEDYAALLRDSPAELAALAADLVVPETWFFRGGRALFDRLADAIAGRAACRSPVRILSIPCSTGEEPYSLVIALHERFTPPDHYRIDAVDLSEAHLARARAARYSAFSFREAGPDIRPVYFYPAADRWDLRSSISGAVRFRQGNIVSSGFLADEPPYDLIICRNLFIYLTPDAKEKALANLDRMLAADGLLCVSPAEADRLPKRQFVPLSATAAGLYRRATAADESVPASAPSRPRPAARRRTAPLRPAPAPSTYQPPTIAARPDPLAQARQLADAGKLAEARVACERILPTSAGNADLHSLIGVIHQAEGRLAEAADAFRRALYLNPDHPEALEHMILISEMRGDASQAAALRRRLVRIADQETP